MKLKIMPPLQLLITLGVMYLIYIATPAIRFYFPGQNKLSILVALLGSGIMGLAIGRFFKVGTTTNPHHPEQASQLVVTGIFNYSRNPMYLGMLIILLAGLIRFGNPINIIPIIGFFMTITQWQIKPEEEILTQKFGDEYKSYCQRVRRWF